MSRSESKGKVRLQRGTKGEFELTVSVLLIDPDDPSDWIDSINDFEGDAAYAEALDWCAQEGYEVVEEPVRLRDLRVNPTPQFFLQTWDGENYRTRQMEEKEDDIWRHMLQHTRSMSNCPARIIQSQVIGEYHGRT